MAKENFPYQLFTVGEEYSRNDINQRLVNSQVSQQSGVSSFADSLVLFATLEKEGRPEEIQYKDFFKGKNKIFSELKKVNSSEILKEGYFQYFKKESLNFSGKVKIHQERELQKNLCFPNLLKEN